MKHSERICYRLAKGALNNLTRALARTLYGVSAAEPLVYVAAATVLVVAASFASFGPARRASSIDPMIALRHE